MKKPFVQQIFGGGLSKERSQHKAEQLVNKYCGNISSKEALCVSFM